MSVTLTGQASAPDAPGAGKFKFYIDGVGQAYVVDENGTVVSVTPAGVNGVGGSVGQVWTADGDDGAAWLDGKPSLSDFQKVYVVDAGGKGDFTTLSEAVSGAPAGSIIIVFGEITETDSVDLGLLTWIGVGAVVSLGGNVASVSSGDDATVRGIKFTGTGGEVLSITGTANIDMENVIAICETASPIGYALNINGGNVVRAKNCKFVSETAVAASVGMYVDDVPADSMFSHCEFRGNMASIAAASAWSNAPIYHSVLSTASANVTPDNGTASGTNVIPS